MSLDTNPQRHEMYLETTYPTGAQEWFCPTCTRRFISQMQPLLSIIELEVGDGYIDHVGCTDGFSRIGIRVQNGDSEEPELSEELLDAMEKALKNANLDDWEDAENPPEKE